MLLSAGMSRWSRRAQRLVRGRLAFVVGLLGAVPLYAQPADSARIQRSIIGWWSNPQYDNLLKPSTDPVYQRRVAIDDQILGWMKQTYEPVGGLGTYRRQNAKLYYGVYFMVWNVSSDPQWLDAKGNFKPIAEENTPFGIQVNAIPGSYPIPYLNEGSKQSYFTWPVDGYGSDATARADQSLADAPASKGFVTRSNERQTVYLAPRNTLPFVPVTIGEYLDLGDSAYAKQLQGRKARIDAQWSGTSDGDRKARASAYESVVQEYAQYKDNIQRTRTKYQSRLNEPAVLRNMQPTFIGDYSNGTDPFEIDAAQRDRHAIFPVYKLTEETLARCQTATPQWVAVWYPYVRAGATNQLLELQRVMREHLNYAYVYDALFEPSKVAGTPYTPLNDAARRQRLASYGRITPKP
jgi:hypothetical protein